MLLSPQTATLGFVKVMLITFNSKYDFNDI